MCCVYVYHCWYDGVCCYLFVVIVMVMTSIIMLND